MLQTDLVINGRYRILHILGVGGMGSVYATHDERLGRQVALKLLRSDIARDQRARDRFLREAQIAAQLIHPNIVRTYDVGEAPEGPYLVQELLQGQTLDTVLPLSPPQTVQVALGVVEALNYLHSQGYVHCDIKPQNIMLIGGLDQPRVVLLDFGIARVEGTDTTTLIATPHYLAPERALGTAPTASSDLYALGIVLFHVLSGRPPFDAPNIHAIIEQHRSAPLPPLKLAADNPTSVAGRGLQAIIHKLSAKQPEQRYPSAAAVRDELVRLNDTSLHNHATQVVANRPQVEVKATPPRRAVPPPPVAPPTTVPSHKTIGLRYLAIPLILAMLLFGAMVMRRGATASPTVLETQESVTPVTPVASVNNEVPPTAAPAPDVNQPPPSPPPAQPAPAAAAVSVPNVVGQPIESAQAQLQTLGLQAVVEAAITSEQPAGTVVSMSPNPDQPLAPGSTVLLQISGGAAPEIAAPNNGDDKEDKDEDKNDDKNDKDKGKGGNKKKD